ncbi:MAG: helix-turn-helix domain-containing protein [Polyangiales bacterium]
MTKSNKTAQLEQCVSYAPAVPEISDKQRLAMAVLLTGGSDSEAADAAGVTRPTVNRWKNQDPQFVAALNEGRKALYQQFSDGVTALLPKAVKALGESLESEDLATRLKAASLVMRTCYVAPSDAETDPQKLQTQWKRADSDKRFKASFTDF